MHVTHSDLPGLITIEPVVHRDPRGFFLETFHARKYAAAGIPTTFVQDNHSYSRLGTLRGLHMQLRHPQGKLVRVVDGAVWDVAVDLRRGSPTFGQWRAEELSADNFRQLYIPPGCAHGFLVLSEAAQVEYKCTAPYDPRDEVGIAWNDPSLAIPWPVSDPVLSARDAAHPALAAIAWPLPVFDPVPARL